MLDPIVEAVLEREGPKDDNPADRGGKTRYGITKPFYTDYLRSVTGNKDASANDFDIEALNIGGARTIYAWYMKETRIGEIINPDVRGVVFDAAVNHGLKPAVKMLQRALAVDVDGVLGPVTLRAIPLLQGEKLAIHFLTQRLRVYADIVAGNLEDKDHDGIPDNVEFIRGWVNRTCAQIEELA